MHVYQHYANVAHDPVVPTPGPSTNVNDAREVFLVELATLSLQLKKAFMVCEAEARQVEEHQRERHRIEDERGHLEGQIEQLKTSLEHAQMERRRKIEYDVFAEKINTLPNREELEQTIKSLENDMAAIREDHDAQNRLIQTQKESLGSIISGIGQIRLLGKDSEASRAATPIQDVTDAGTPSLNVTIPTEDEKEEGEEQSSDDVPLSASLNPFAKPFNPVQRASATSISTSRLRSRSGQSSTPASAKPDDDDIEMGEVAEDPKDNNRGKRRIRLEELEEGEASDESSELSELPDD
ncbi:hypothetical protein EWM64_g5144 [Hericium alpestre]|uniref:Uncharacterized protein n=1 Tax=Hericium alpestre TaxID=135208 RepID=A0A4Y9ZXW9_9AGAM|nr:hypothetical protein EWM64_g5144 [Hericium alpestre]